jgi:hypothetical protein
MSGERPVHHIPIVQTGKNGKLVKGKVSQDRKKE